MTIASVNEAVKLVRELDAAVPHLPGLSLRVSNFLRDHDYVEGVGSFEVDSIVYFDPMLGKGPRMHAKVLASYGTWDGKVFYDIALSYNEGESFVVTVPLRDVPPSMIRLISDVEAGDSHMAPVTAAEVATQSA